jgi:hypothetical protein
MSDSAIAFADDPEPTDAVAERMTASDQPYWEQRPKRPLRDLSEIAAELNAADALSVGAFRSGLQHAYRAGQLLFEVKDRLAHGEYLPWLAANTTISRRTASNYMLLAANEHRIAHLDVDGIHDALRLLRSPLDVDLDHDPRCFKSVGLDIPTDYRCPNCLYEWSGNPKPPLAPKFEAATGKLSRLRFGVARTL